MQKKLFAEIFGTFWLVFGGCGSAVLAATFGGTDSNLGIGFVGVALAFGLTVLTMAYTIGPISGCHLNPAVTLGLVVGGRHPIKEAAPYMAAQVIGATLGAGTLYLIVVTGRSDVSIGGFASNGFGDLSPGGYSMVSAMIAEIVLTFFFVFVIMGSTDARAPVGFAPIAIGLCLTLIHLIGIPITNLSVNPARSTGPALFADTAAIEQLWLFWVAPLVGGSLGGVVYKTLLEQKN